MHIIPFRRQALRLSVLVTIAFGMCVFALHIMNVLNHSTNLHKDRPSPDGSMNANYSVTTQPLIWGGFAHKGILEIASGTGKKVASHHLSSRQAEGFNAGGAEISWSQDSRSVTYRAISGATLAYGSIVTEFEITYDTRTREWTTREEEYRNY